MEINEKDFVYLGQFIWNKEKAEINKQKHGVSFETASKVFSDENLLTEYDEKNSTLEEDRFDCIGIVDGIAFLFVAMTDRNDMIRIISARKAETSEVKKYEKRIKAL